MGRQLPESISPDCPQEAIYLWTMFLEVSERRGSNGFGMNPLTFTEIQAWERMTRSDLSPFEIRAITALDSLYLRLQTKE